MDGEDWKNYRDNQQARRKSRLQDRTDAINAACLRRGIPYKWLTPYQIRVTIDGIDFDYYPIHSRLTRVGSGKFKGVSPEYFIGLLK